MILLDHTVAVTCLSNLPIPEITINLRNVAMHQPSMNDVWEVRVMGSLVAMWKTSELRTTVVSIALFCIILFVSPSVWKFEVVWLHVIYSSYLLFMQTMVGKITETTLFQKCIILHKKAQMTTNIFTVFLRAVDASIGVHG